MSALTNLIRSKALVQYFQPFASIRLERMSQAFGWSVNELEQQVVSLIQSGEIKARVDRQNKVRSTLISPHPSPVLCFYRTLSVRKTLLGSQILTGCHVSICRF